MIICDVRPVLIGCGTGATSQMISKVGGAAVRRSAVPAAYADLAPVTLYRHVAPVCPPRTSAQQTRA